MSTDVSARRAQTRDRLIDAALTVFAERGVGGASVEEICDTAGFTRGAFYSNFETKDDLCLAVLERQTDEDMAAARRAIASVASAGPEGGATPRDTDALIAAAIAVFLSAQRADRRWVLASSELRLYAAREASLREAYLSLTRRTGDLFAALVTEAAAGLGYELAVSGPDAVSVLHAVFDHGAVDALIQGRPAADEARAQQLVAVLRALLRPRTAHPGGAPES